jgi:hypothetical protein
MGHPVVIGELNGTAKKSRLIIVGSPPCHATVTSGDPTWASISCRRYVSSRSSAIRNRLPGYSNSLDRKKQYSQSRLQMAPVGFASRWNAAGASGSVGNGEAAIRVSMLN